MQIVHHSGRARYTWMAVPIQVSGGTPQIGEPKPLFTFISAVNTAPNNLFVYSPAADGQRLLVNARPIAATGTLNVVTNWEKAAVGNNRKNE